MCETGTYKNSTGNATCNRCADFSSSPEGSTLHTNCSCDAGYKGLAGDACGKVCPPGSEHGALNLVCIECNTSHYKPEPGDHPCTACPAYAHHSLTNQTSIAACVCQAGYLWNPDSEACDPCPSGTFNNKGGEGRCFDCTQASPPSDLPPAASSCPGMTSVPAGYETTGSGANIEPCPVNHYNDGTGLKCTLCPSPSTATTDAGLLSLAECVCRPGFTRVDGVCGGCGVGSYKSGAGDGICVGCPAHSTTLQEASADISECVCSSNFEPSGNACAVCSGDSAKHVVGNLSCISCNANAFLPPEKEHLATHCTCNLGYTGDGTSCVACAHGFYKEGTGSGPCVGCAEHATTASDASPSISSCFCAPEDEYASVVTGPDEGGGCIPTCTPGRTGAATDCQACAAGTFKPEQGPEPCTACAAPTTASLGESKGPTDCTCPQGELDDRGTTNFLLTSVGSLREDTVLSNTLCSSLPCESPHQASRRLRLLHISPDPGAVLRDVQVTVTYGETALLLFSCSSDCALGPSGQLEVALEGLRELWLFTPRGSRP